jgi:DNA-binding sugar fermentation-stimulating protein
MKQAKADVKVDACEQRQKEYALCYNQTRNMHFVCINTMVILEIISTLLQHTRKKCLKVWL